MVVDGRVRAKVAGAMLGFALCGVDMADAAVLRITRPEPTFEYVASSGETNRLDVSLRARAITFADRGARISLRRTGGRCATRSPGVVRCSLRRADFPPALDVRLRDQADS